MRSRANGWAVVPGDVDNRHRNVRLFKTVAYRDPRNPAQIDVENDANHSIEIAVICESFSRGKQHAFIAALPQQSRYALQHHGVVIDDQNKVPLGKAGHLDAGNPPFRSNTLRPCWQQSDDHRLDPCQAKRQWSKAPCRDACGAIS